MAGDVVAIEPGLWDLRIGGVRFEDLLLVTEDGLRDADRLLLLADAGPLTPLPMLREATES